MDDDGMIQSYLIVSQPFIPIFTSRMKPEWLQEANPVKIYQPPTEIQPISAAWPNHDSARSTHDTPEIGADQVIQDRQDGRLNPLFEKTRNDDN